MTFLVQRGSLGPDAEAQPWPRAPVAQRKQTPSGQPPAHSLTLLFRGGGTFLLLFLFLTWEEKNQTQEPHPPGAEPKDLPRETPLGTQLPGQLGGWQAPNPGASGLTPSPSASPRSPVALGARWSRGGQVPIFSFPAPVCRHTRPLASRPPGRRLIGRK